MEGDVLIYLPECFLLLQGIYLYDNKAGLVVIYLFLWCIHTRYINAIR
jgi:hypothetical protein